METSRLQNIAKELQSCGGETSSARVPCERKSTPGVYGHQVALSYIPRQGTILALLRVSASDK